MILVVTAGVWGWQAKNAAVHGSKGEKLGPGVSDSVPNPQPALAHARNAASPATLQQQIRATMEAEGASRSDVLSMIQIAETTCANHRSNSNSIDPNYWPAQYLEQACKGFDGREFSPSHSTPSPDVVMIQRSKGVDSAAAFAAKQIASADVDFSTKIVSGWYLIEHGAFPNRVEYKLDNDELARAFAGAVGLDLCTRLQACQSQSAMTAGLCETMACPPGATYEDALRLRLTGGEFEAAIKIRRNLMARSI